MTGSSSFAWKVPTRSLLSRRVAVGRRIPVQPGIPISPVRPILNMIVCRESGNSDILHLIFGDRATGSGHLYGRLPLRVRWRPQPGISFGAGTLMLHQGQEPSISTDREVLDNALATGLPGARGDRKSRAFRDGIARHFRILSTQVSASPSPSTLRQAAGTTTSKARDACRRTAPPSHASTLPKSSFDNALNKVKLRT